MSLSSSFKTCIKALLVPVLRFVLRSPKLKGFFMARLQKHPGLKARLRRVLTGPSPAASGIPPEELPYGLGATLGELSPRGKHFYKLLTSELTVQPQKERL